MLNVVLNVFKISSKDTRRISFDVVMVSLLLTVGRFDRLFKLNYGPL